MSLPISQHCMPPNRDAAAPCLEAHHKDCEMNMNVNGQNMITVVINKKKPDSATQNYVYLSQWAKWAKKVKNHC